MKIALLTAAVLVLSTGLAAQDWSEPVSATIQVTATVVPTLGGTLLEEPVQLASLDGYVGLQSMPSTADPEGALIRHSLKIQFPSLSSVLVSVESDAGVVEYLPLAECHIIDVDADSKGPGAMEIDIGDLAFDLAVSGGDCIVTLIYSEN